MDAETQISPFVNLRDSLLGNVRTHHWVDLGRHVGAVGKAAVAGPQETTVEVNVLRETDLQHIPHSLELKNLILENGIVIKT